MNAQQSAYCKGFDAGYTGSGPDDTPYKGHTTGFHRGLANQWKRGCENGDMAASMLHNALRKRDKATDLEGEGDNAHVKGDLPNAVKLWGMAAQMLKQASDDLRYHVNLVKTKERDDEATPKAPANPERG